MLPILAAGTPPYRRLPATTTTTATTTTVDEVIARMQAIDAALPATDGLASFNRMYLDVPRAVSRNVADGSHHDGYLRIDALLGASERSIRESSEPPDVRDLDRHVAAVLDLVDNWSSTPRGTLRGRPRWRCGPCATSTSPPDCSPAASRTPVAMASLGLLVAI